MRKLLSLVILAALLALPLIAQNPPIRFSDGKPQVAYHLFSTWADNYMARARRGKIAGESILLGTGALAVGGAAATWYAGDTLSQQAGWGSMDYSLKQDLTMGLGIGGGLLLASGLIVSAVPIKDYRAIYADVFEERDSEVQEAMAVSVLRYQADRGKERRISSFIAGVAVPVLAGLITGGANVAQGRRWDDGMFDSLRSSSWTMAWSVTSLFTKTEEERLYERYLTTRDALNAAR